MRGLGGVGRAGWEGLSGEQWAGVMQGFVCFEVGLRKLSVEGVVGAYLPHVANVLAMRGWRTRIDEGRRDKLTKIIIRRFERAAFRDRPMLGRAKTAFTLAMAEAATRRPGAGLRPEIIEVRGRRVGNKFAPGGRRRLGLSGADRPHGYSYARQT